MLQSLCLFLAIASSRTLDPIYKNPQASLEQRVNDLFSRLTNDEKMDILTGTAFTTRPIPRLNIPALSMSDAGQGVRGGMESTQGPATAFPSGVAMASTWNPELVGRIGKAIGEEALNKGTGSQILLGPAVNIQRSPLGGRNGEYFSEDPFLAGRLAIGYIQGMQSTGCAACVKHYVANNEEVDRDYVNVKVSERALREIYLPAFEAAVKEGHVWTVMSSYNMINGFHASANRYLLTNVLKKGWGFDGMVMSDWGGVHETSGAIMAGNDLEMPGPGFLRKDRVEKALANGDVTQSQIDDNVRRILRTVIRCGVMDHTHTPDHSIVDSKEHRHLTYEAASEGIVLLKNERHILPLERKSIRSIAVIGRPADDMQIGANGSPIVIPFYKVQPLDGIRKLAGKNIEVRYVESSSSGNPIPTDVLVPPTGDGHGLKAEYFNNRTLTGSPKLVRRDDQVQFKWNGAPVEGLGHENFSVRWTGKLVAPSTGNYTFTLSADDGCRLFIDNREVISHWTESGETPISGSIDLEKGKSYEIRIEYFQAGGLAAIHLNWTTPGTKRFAEAIDAAKRSDAVIVFAGTLGQEGEGYDRPSMPLPSNQDDLIQAVAAANKRTVVVLNNGTPVGMTKWIDQVPGLVEAWFPGQEGGAALASVLFGDVNPSGKLPTTLAAAREDYPDNGNFPGVKGRVNYAEGIYVGYRHFDKERIKPLFPFGFGLSYTSFAYEKPQVSYSANSLPQLVSLSIKNTGDRDGAEVVELYVHPVNPQMDRPIRELKGFAKVFLKSGQTKTISIPLDMRSFAYCDVPGRQWKVDTGDYDLEIGSSSRDIRQTVRTSISNVITEAIPYMEDQSMPKAKVEKDLAEGCKVLASSVEERPDVAAEYAVDGDDQTRWSSKFADPQWLAIDLGKAQTVDHVVIKWESAFAESYAIQVSDDGQNWRDVFNRDTSLGSIETLKFSPTKTQWIRLFAKKRATQYGVSLFSFEVYGPEGNS